jgi:hypothetical protein
MTQDSQGLTKQVSSIGNASDFHSVNSLFELRLFCVYLQSLQANSEIISQILPQLLPWTHFSIRYRPTV